jgi:hypothetical protein
MEITMGKCIDPQLYKEQSNMGRIKFVTVLFVSFALLLFIKSGISAQEIPPAWQLDGEVYHMISSPYMPEDRDPQASLVSYLGSYDKTQWRLFRWDPAKSKYIELKTPEWGLEQDLDYGRGYWIISKNPAGIHIEGSSVADNWITLEHGGPTGTGWNQIGNIYDYPFPMDNIEVGPEGGPYVPLTDDANIYTGKLIWEWVDGNYRPAVNQMEVGRGYWIKNITWETLPSGIPVELKFSTGLGPVSALYDVYSVDMAQEEEPPSPPPAIENSSSSSSITFSGGSGGGSRGCFIATVAYGDYDHPSVQLLREFRDRFLLTNSFGRMFVGTYYLYGPALARFAAHREPIKVLARFTLTPVTGVSHFVSKINPYSFFVVVVFTFLGSLFLFKRGMGGRCKPKISKKEKKGKMKV